MPKRFVIMLDSGAYSVWARSNPHRLQLRRHVLEAVKIHGSKKKVAEALGIPLGLVQNVTSDDVERKVTLENYAEFVNGRGHLFRGGVWNFDVIGSDKGSYENWLELRRLGVDAVPVHHVGDDESYLKKYLDECEYIGIGAIAKMDASSRIAGLDHVWKTYLTAEDGSARYRVHGLGLTDTSIVLRYPWYSVDSTKTIATAAYGTILMPNLKGARPSYADLNPVSVSDQSRKVVAPVRRKVAGYSDIRERAFGTAGGSMNFYLLPQRVQDSLRDLASERGLTIRASLEGRILRTKNVSRKKQDAIWENGLGIEISEPTSDGDDQNSLSSSWKARYAFNLKMIDRFVEHHRQRGKVVRLYNVVGSGHVFDAFALMSDSHPANRALVSFAKMSDSLIYRLECAVGNPERSTVNGNQTSTTGDSSKGTLRSSQQGGVQRREGGGVQRRGRNSTPPAWRP